MDIEVKLQGGPSHGKVTRARFREVIINTAKARPMDYFTASTDTLVQGPAFDIRVSRYQMLVIQNPLDPTGPRIPCMNHKGQAIYQYVKE